METTIQISIKPKKTALKLYYVKKTIHTYMRNTHTIVLTTAATMESASLGRKQVARQHLIDGPRSDKSQYLSICEN